MPKFTKIPETTFESLQLNAGIYLKTFDPKTGTVDVGEIIGATTGGSQFGAKPTFIDFGEDVDNCPKGSMELMKLDDWDISMSSTYVTYTANTIKALLAAADITTEGDVAKITLRKDIMPTDFEDIWWVGDYSDKNGEKNGGCIAIHLLNVLSTEGFSLATADKNKGKGAFTYKAHYSIQKQEEVPCEIYVVKGKDENASDSASAGKDVTA